SFDEALALPTKKSASVALRTQQIIAHESGAADSVDPLAGSYFVEYLTDELETSILGLLDTIDQEGGALAGIESSYFKNEIARSAYQYQKRIESGEDVVVGVNRFQMAVEKLPDLLKVDAEAEESQIKRLTEIKSSRDQTKVSKALIRLEKAAQSADNMFIPVAEAVRNRVTVGEIAGKLREVWGEYDAK
ncbi:MAG: methylmalonyl-CoA mutase, partial [FCB group bacterium]|nr:methylmalonyl-CoA mutase [FCB group bacterium]